MSPFELASTIERELAGQTPKLAAAINKALMYHGSGNLILTPSGQAGGSDPFTIEEQESLQVKPEEPTRIMMSVMAAADLLESHSSWQLITDAKPADAAGRFELRYTLVRHSGGR